MLKYLLLIFTFEKTVSNIEQILLFKTNVVSTQKKKHEGANLGEFDRDTFFGFTTNDGRRSVEIKNGLFEIGFTSAKKGGLTSVNEIILNIQTLETNLTDRFAREMENVNEIRIQNAILAEKDTLIAPKIKFAITSTNASLGRCVGSVGTSCEREEQTGKATFF